MKKSLGAYMNKSQTSYRQIHNSRSSVALTQRKHTTKAFTRHPNGIVIGSSKQQKGLILFQEGCSILHIKSNGLYKQTLYCFSNMSYCYQIQNQSKTGVLTQLLFYKADIYLMLYTLKNDRQDGFQYTYDYLQKKMTKSYYKNNQLRQILETCTMKPYEAEHHHQFVDMFKKLSEFNFSVEGCKRVEISNTMTYFGQAKNDSPNGFGLILSLDERYIGCFKDGLLQGFGTIFFSNGDICQGLFNEGESSKCSRYTKAYGTIYFINGKVAGEEQYSCIISEYKNRFTIDNHDVLVPQVRDIIIQLKQNLDIFEKKKNIKIPVPQIKSQTSGLNTSQIILQKQILTNKLVMPFQSKDSWKMSSKNGKIAHQLQLSSKISIEQKSPIKLQKIDNILGKSKYQESDEQQKDDFFDQMVIEEVNQDTVAEEVKKNVPKSMEVQVMKQRRTNEINFMYNKQEGLIGNYLMDMIKENSNDRQNSQEKGISLITDRIKKSRIFSGKKPRIDRITFTF